MAHITIDRVDGMRAWEIMHAQTSALPSQTTVAQARAYFAASESRRLAVLADEGFYRGALTPADLEREGNPGRPVIEVAGTHATVLRDAPAAMARDLALASDTRRVPVLDDAGRFLGIVSINRGGEWFCGTG